MCVCCLHMHTTYSSVNCRNPSLLRDLVYSRIVHQVQTRRDFYRIPRSIPVR